jgi:hypothetical protein
MSAGPGNEPTCEWDEYRPSPDGRGDEVYWHCEEEAVTTVKTRSGTMAVCGPHAAEAIETGLANGD